MSSPVELAKVGDVGLELDLEELFFHLRAKGNEIQSN
jgi:hypothetical protein